jgi:hypothetical protein
MSTQLHRLAILTAAGAIWACFHPQEGDRATLERLARARSANSSVLVSVDERPLAVVSPADVDGFVALRLASEESPRELLRELGVRPHHIDVNGRDSRVRAAIEESRRLTKKADDFLSRSKAREEEEREPLQNRECRGQRGRLVREALVLLFPEQEDIVAAWVRAGCRGSCRCRALPADRGRLSSTRSKSGPNRASNQRDIHGFPHPGPNDLLARMSTRRVGCEWGVGSELHAT